MERDPLPPDERELEEIIETTGVTGTDSPATDAHAPAIEELLGSPIPGTLAPDQIEPPAPEEQEQLMQNPTQKQ